MDLHDLVRALLRYDALSARQWVADAARAGLRWASLPLPMQLDPLGLTVAAGVVETLAARAHQSPPDWTSGVGPAPEPVFLVRSAREMPRLRRMCEQGAPEPLRRRRLLAPPDFLTVA